MREHDVLVVHKFLKRTPVVDLVSLLKSYVDGDVIVWVFRVPMDRLPNGAKIGDQLVVKGTDLVPANMDTINVHRYKGQLRLKKHFAGVSDPTNSTEFRSLVKEMLEFTSEHSLFFRQNRRQT